MLTFIATFSAHLVEKQRKVNAHAKVHVKKAYFDRIYLIKPYINGTFCLVK